MTGRWLAAALGAAALAGCGSGGSGGAPSFEERIESTLALSERIAALENSSFRSMPTEGSASYEGAIAVGNLGAPDGTGTALYGDVALRADFLAGTIGGRADRFFGTVEGGDVRDYGGSLAITGGEIGAARPNAWTAEVAGTIAGGDDRVTVDADLVGDFKGAGGRALVAADPISLGTVNGRPEVLSVAVVGER